MKTKTHKVILSGLFVALGVILPYFTSHGFGLSGTVLLPMHIPVLLCGLICGAQFGAIAGIITPILSSLLTSMPAVYPMLPIMAMQLMTLGLVSGIFYQTLKRSIYLSVLVAMIADWVVYGLMLSLMLLMNSNLQILSVPAALVKGIPGIVVQLVIIPVIISALQRYLGKGYGAKAEQISDIDGLDEALNIIKQGDVSCVVIKEGKVIYTADGRGVSPILDLYHNNPEILKGATVVDKIIGKAAAMLLVLGGAKQAYGRIMSVAGRDYLNQYGIDVGHGMCVDVISNRDGNGICPMEKSVMDAKTPMEGLERIEARLRDLRAAIS